MTERAHKVFSGCQRQSYTIARGAVIPESVAHCPELMAEGYLQVKGVICVRGQVLNRLLVHLEIVCVIVSGSAALGYVCASKSAACNIICVGRLPGSPLS